MKQKNENILAPCDIIFNYVDKPEKYAFCKSVNVFDNRYRINIYSNTLINNINSIRISNSYFVKMNNNKLEIIT